MWPTLECWCWCLTEPLARTWRLYIPSVGGGTGYPRPPGHTTATSSRTQGENGHKKWGLVDSLDRRWMPSWWECVGFVRWCQMSGCSDCSVKPVMCDCWHVQSTQHIMDRCYLLIYFWFCIKSWKLCGASCSAMTSSVGIVLASSVSDHSLAGVQCPGSDQAVTSGDWHRTAKDLDHFCSFCIHNKISIWCYSFSYV